MKKESPPCATDMKNSSYQCSFDAYASKYDKELQKGLLLTGEDKTYFARRRVQWIAKLLGNELLNIRYGIDYGCGIGDTAPILSEILGLEKVIGMDISHQALEKAKKKYFSPNIQFIHPSENIPEGKIDLLYCNGVFHHIPNRNHLETLNFFNHLLRKDGILAFWENNPWNLGTRLAMKLVPFDKGAKLLWPAQAKKNIQLSRFDVFNESYLFIFPKIMQFFRRVEPLLARLPIGGQYLILAKKIS